MLTVKEKILTVSEFTSSIKGLIESKTELKNVALRGEISNLTTHSSGHLYFSLKDETSILCCVMFRAAATTLNSEGIMLWPQGKSGLPAFKKRKFFFII